LPTTRVALTGFALFADRFDLIGEQEVQYVRGAVRDRSTNSLSQPGQTRVTPRVATATVVPPGTVVPPLAKTGGVSLGAVVAFDGYPPPYTLLR
jgi:hypothetical protein